MNSDCDSKHSGFVRWWQLTSAFLALLVITVTILLYQASAMVRIDESSRSRDSAILETFSGMKASLARIEAKLEIRK